MKSSTPSSQLRLSTAEFLDSVLRLQPKLAAFDCDGTLWAGDAGERFFNWEFEQKLVPDEVIRASRARYAEYRAGKVSEDEMCAEMVTLNRGLTEAEMKRAAARFFEDKFTHQIFSEIRELVSRLQEIGCEIWAVSSTNEWVIQAAMNHFGIPHDRILAAKVEIEDGRVTDRVVRVPSGDGKPRAIREVVGRIPDVAFGNSRWDAAMLELARNAYAVNPNPDLENVAQQRGWKIYFPESVRR